MEAATSSSSKVNTRGLTGDSGEEYEDESESIAELLWESRVLDRKRRY